MQTRPATAGCGASYHQGYFDETVEAGTGLAGAACNSTNGHQVVIYTARVTTGVAGVRDSAGASLKVLNAAMVLLA